ncbi:MAG: DUF1848 domain-containing protein [Duncaniella sp.]|nr:DUF1848 domain-containing protein [Duncaniella sp.]HBI57901.1 hypothetical protein [Porphyromonadaceae bacterium]
MKNEKIKLTLGDGNIVEAQAPQIVSASRATDIPAFYNEWFFNRLDKGYARWRNPYNGKDSYVSFDDTKFIVFWSKNPAPLLPFLPILKQKGIGCYIQFTLNDYVAEGLEPNVPPLFDRIETFKRLVDELGLGSVVWRFDPLILTDRISAEDLLHKISNIAGELYGYVEKLVFSFADISSYRKVGRNLSETGINYHEWTEDEMVDFSRRLADMNLGLELATCAEKIDLSEFGINHNRCIDPELIYRLSPEVEPIIRNLRADKGQRSLCGCITSKDIGAYNTCPHGCVYCYANTSPVSARQNYLRHQQNPDNDSII